MFKLHGGLLWAVGFCILFPLSFQIDGGVYRAQEALLDSGGILTKIPLPLSLMSLVAIISLWTPESRVKPALASIAGMFAVCVISLWAGSDGETPHNRKLITSIQLILPLLGLLLGQLVGNDKEKIIARAFMITISIVVPWQLVAGFIQNDSWSAGNLTHNLFAFSIYAHRQYVTLIFICAFAYSMVSLWQEYKRWFTFLSLLMLVYVSISLSFLTIFAYFSFILFFLVNQFLPNRPNWKLVGTSLFAFSVISWGGYSYFQKVNLESSASTVVHNVFHGKFDALIKGQVPSNVQTRIEIWEIYSKEILTSQKTLIVGHPQPMPREMKANPHNWYLDIVYSFGMIGLLPIASLMAFTTYSCWRSRKKLTKPAWILVSIVFYIVLVDNNFKSTLRQPYPGIFTYFLWGILLQNLCGSESLSKNSAANE
jgi:hypothetical protein